MLDLGSLDGYVGQYVDVNMSREHGAAGVVTSVSALLDPPNGDAGRWINFDWGFSVFVTQSSTVTRVGMPNDR